MKHVFAVLLLLASPTLAQGADPAAAVSAFYAVYQGQQAHGGGIPDATGRLRYSGVLSSRLNKQMLEAARAQDKLTAKVHNAVPPMLEGDIFSSLFEGATAWKIGACSGDAKTQRCNVALTHVVATAPGAKPEKPANWNDTVVVVSTPAGWRVDDVLYDANFAFGNTGKLSDMLQMVVSQNP
jgi:hypothetical protein